MAIIIFGLVSGNAFAQEAEKGPNPTGALLRSAVIPGWGQFYNRKYIKAAVIAGIEGYLYYGTVTDWREADRHERAFKTAIDPVVKAREFADYEDARDRRNLKMWFLAAGIFYSMFDAYVDAHLATFDQPDKAYEVYLGPTEDGVRLALTLDIP